KCGVEEALRGESYVQALRGGSTFKLPGGSTFRTSPQGYPEPPSSPTGAPSPLGLTGGKLWNAARPRSAGSPNSSTNSTSHVAAVVADVLEVGAWLKNLDPKGRLVTRFTSATFCTSPDEFFRVFHECLAAAPFRKQSFTKVGACHGRLLASNVLVGAGGEVWLTGLKGITDGQDELPNLTDVARLELSLMFDTSKLRNAKDEEAAMLMVEALILDHRGHATREDGSVLWDPYEASQELRDTWTAVRALREHVIRYNSLDRTQMRFLLLTGALRWLETAEAPGGSPSTKLERRWALGVAIANAFELMLTVGSATYPHSKYPVQQQRREPECPESQLGDAVLEAEEPSDERMQAAAREQMHDTQLFVHRAAVETMLHRDVVTGLPFDIMKCRVFLQEVVFTHDVTPMRREDVLAGRGERLSREMVDLKLMPDSVNVNLEENPLIAIIGEMMCGKTTLVQQIQVACAMIFDIRPSKSAECLVPLVLPALEFSKALSKWRWLSSNTKLKLGMQNGKKRIIDYRSRKQMDKEAGAARANDVLLEFMTNLYGKNTVQKEVVQRALVNGNLLVILDGIDQTGAFMGNIEEWLRQERERGIRFRVILTCRQTAYEGQKFAKLGFKTLSIEPMLEDRMDSGFRRRLKEWRPAALKYVDAALKAEPKWRRFLTAELYISVATQLLTYQKPDPLPEEVSLLRTQLRNEANFQRQRRALEVEFQDDVWEMVMAPPVIKGQDGEPIYEAKPLFPIQRSLLQRATLNGWTWRAGGWRQNLSRPALRVYRARRKRLLNQRASLPETNSELLNRVLQPIFNTEIPQPALIHLREGTFEQLHDTREAISLLNKSMHLKTYRRIAMQMHETASRTVSWETVAVLVQQEVGTATAAKLQTLLPAVLQANMLPLVKMTLDGQGMMFEHHWLQEFLAADTLYAKLAVDLLGTKIRLASSLVATFCDGSSGKRLQFERVNNTWWQPVFAHMMALLAVRMPTHMSKLLITLKDFIGTAMMCTLFAYIVRAGITEAVRSFIKEDMASMDVPDVAGLMPMQVAVENGHWDIVAAFLEMGTDPNIRLPDTTPCLHLASSLQIGAGDMVRLLLGSAKVPPDIGTRFSGLIALHVAAQNGCLEAVKVLLEHGADVNSLTPSNETALHLAAEATAGSSQEVCCLLLSQGINFQQQDDMGDLALNRAVVVNPPGTVEALCRAHNMERCVATISAGMLYSLHHAARTGNVGLARLTLAEHAAVDGLDAEGNTPLMNACIHGSLSMAKLLLMHRARHDIPNKQQLYPLEMAAIGGSRKSSEGHIELAKELLGYGADYAELLRRCAWKGRLKEVRCLTQAGCRLNAVDEDTGRAAIHGAAEAGFDLVVKDLTENGALFDEPDDEMLTPIELAAMRSHTEVVRILYALGAKPYRMLQKASQDGNKVVVNCLLSVGISPDGGEFELPRPDTAGSESDVEPMMADETLRGAESGAKDDDEAGCNVAGEPNAVGGPASPSAPAFPRALSVPSTAAGVKSGPQRFASINTELDLRRDTSLPTSEAFHAGVENVEAKTGELALSPTAQWPKRKRKRKRNKEAKNYFREWQEMPSSRPIVKPSLVKNTHKIVKRIVRLAPLDVAAEDGHVEVVRSLLGAGASGEKPLERALLEFRHHAVNCILEAGFDPYNVMLDQAEVENVDAVKALLLAGAKADRALYHWAGKVEDGRAAVRCLLQAGANADITIRSYAREGHLKVLEMLFQEKAAEQEADAEGMRALHLAAREGHGTCIVELLDNHPTSDVTHVNAENHTALRLACRGNHLLAVRVLLERGGASPNDAADELGRTHLMDASEKGFLEVVRALVEHKAELEGVDNAGYSAVDLASMGYFKELVMFLLVDCSVGSDNALKRQAQSGSDKAVKCILDAGAEPTTVLLGEALEDNYATVSLLVREGAAWEYALQNAAADGSVVAAKCMKAAGVPLESTLLLVADDGDPISTECLLEAGADPDCRDTDDNTPLQLAAIKGHADVIKLLLKYGANFSVANKEKASPLEFATMSLFTTSVHHLIHAGCMALELLGDHARENRHRQVSCLLEAGQLMDDLNKSGKTALHEASELGHLNTVKALLDFAASTSVRDTQGKVPLDLAAAAGRRDVCRALLQAGAISAPTLTHFAETLDKATCDVLVQAGCPVHEVIVAFCKARNEAGVKTLLKASANPASVFSSAAETGEVATIKWLLKMGADAVALLRQAVRENDVKVVKSLLSGGTPPDKPCPVTTRRPLQDASDLGYVSMVQLLLTKVTKPDQEDEYGVTAMELAAKRRLVEMQLEAALADEAAAKALPSVDLGSSESRPASSKGLLRAAGEDTRPSSGSSSRPKTPKASIYTQIMDALTVAGASGFKLLKTSATKDEAEIIKIVMKAGAPTDPVLNTLSKEGSKAAVVTLLKAAVPTHNVMKACAQGGMRKNLKTMIEAEVSYHQVVRELAEEEEINAVALVQTMGGDLCANLMEFAKEGNCEAVEVMLDAGVELMTLDAERRTCMHWAGYHGHIPLVKTLISRNMAIDNKDIYMNTPLRLATRENQSAAAEILRKHADHLIFVKKVLAAQLTFKGEGYKAGELRTASERGIEEEVERLLLLGVDPDDSVERGNGNGQNSWTPLHLAALNKHLRVTELLLDAEADTTAVNGNGWTPLHMACISGSAEIADTIIEGVKKVNINVKGQNQRTPLHLAVMYEHPALCELLCQNGAWVNEPDVFYRTPLKEAESNKEILEILNSYVDR
ncbi:hypothetical protein CYMTET_44856, partial [Cymbomonas tetramitiformis]